MSDGLTPAGADGSIDYVIFLFRKFGVLGGVANIYGSHTAITNFGDTPQNFTINTGFSGQSFDGGFSTIHFHKFFTHELAHTLYGCPHYLGANGTAGQSFYVSYGWGMMSEMHAPFNTANAWERWWLGWIEPQTITTNGTYVLNDFMLEGDALRIPIPGFPDHYLWLENHQKLHPLDNKVFPGFKPQEAAPGVYAYVTAIGHDRSVTLNPFVNTNRIRMLNGSGHYDYSWSSTIIDGNTLPVFKKEAYNPINGQSDYWAIRDEFSSISTDPSHANPDEIYVQDSYNGNTDGFQENRGVSFELINSVLEETNAWTANDHMSFPVGSEIGMSGITAALNIPFYNMSTKTLGNYFLNGLSVKILSFNSSTNEYTIEIAFNNFQLTKNTRWCGGIELPNLTGNTDPDLIVQSGYELRIDKSGTPNTHNRLADGTFSRPTVFYSNNSTVENNGTIVIENNSTYVLDADAVLDIKTDANVIVKTGGRLLIKAGGLASVTGNLRIEEGGFLEIETGGRLEIENGGMALIDFRGRMLFHPDAEIEFKGNTSLLEFKGLLEIMENATFKVITQGASRGVLRFNFIEDPLASSQHNILTNGNNCQVDLSMTQSLHYKIEIMSSTYIYPKDNLLLFNIDMAVVYMDEDAFFNIGCPLSAVNTYVSKMPGNLLLYCHSGFKIYGQPNVNFDGMRMYHAKNGIRAYQNFGGNNLVVKNSIFRKCKSGIQVYHNGFYIQNNRFFECNLAIDVQMPTIFTIAENNYFSENYGNMIIAGSGGSGLVAAGNIFRNGQFSEISNTSATFLCNSFIKNGIGTLSGYNGSRINMSSTELTLIQTSNGLVVGGKNKFLQNIENFNSYNNSSYNLIDGYNQFVLGTNSFYSIMANKFATPLDRNFNLNTWDPALPTPPSIYPTPSPTPLSLNNTNHFQLTINSSMPYYVQGITTTWDNTCPISDFQDALEEPLNPSIMTDEHQGGTETLLMSGTFTNLPVTFNNYINASELVVGGVFNGIEFETALNTAVNDAYLGQEGMIVRVDRNGLSDLSDLLIHVYDNTSNEDVFQQAYKLYLQLINNAVADSVFHPDSIVSSDYNDAIALIDSLILLTETNNTDTGYAKKKISYLLDKANVYRVFRQYDNCLSVLDEALYFAEDLDLMLVGIWQCFLTKERDAFLDVIDRDSFTVAVEECYNLYTIYHDSLVAQYGTVDTTTNIPIIPFSYTMTPNPVSSTLTANIVVDEDCELSLIILDRFGATKYSTNLGLLTEGNHYHPVDVSAYSSDLYHMIIIGCGHYDSQQFIVVHPAQ